MNNLRQKFIKWPHDSEKKLTEIVFGKQCGIQGVSGLIDTAISSHRISGNLVFKKRNIMHFLVVPRENMPLTHVY